MPKRAKSRHNSLLQQNSVKFGSSFTWYRKHFTQKLFARLYVFASLKSCLVAFIPLIHGMEKRKPAGNKADLYSFIDANHIIIKPKSIENPNSFNILIIHMWFFCCRVSVTCQEKKAKHQLISFFHNKSPIIQS